MIGSKAILDIVKNQGRNPAEQIKYKFINNSFLNSDRIIRYNAIMKAQKKRNAGILIAHSDTPKTL